MMMSGGEVGGGDGGNGGGPCGACKFLRRKCVKGCIFAPYFDSEQGTTHFAAVHRVFGASNASKLLLRIPPHRRLDAVITLCYEALSRVKDPVYGCVGHIFTLQQQVVNLQAELAYVQARISMVQRTVPMPLPNDPTAANLPPSPTNQTVPFESEETSMDLLSFCDVSDEGLNDGYDLQALAREYYVLKYFPGVRFKPSPPPPSSQ